MDKKLVVELKNNDRIFVVDTDMSIIECTIKIDFDEPHHHPEGFISNRFHGIIETGENKFHHNHSDFQVFRIGTADTEEEKFKISRKDCFAFSPCNPETVMPDVYHHYLYSTSFKVLNYVVFTNLEDAKDYILDQKLKDIRNELAKTIKIRKYKSKEQH